MLTKRFYIIKQILPVKAEDLFQCVRTPSGQYATGITGIQGLLLTKIKTEISNSCVRV